MAKYSKKVWIATKTIKVKMSIKFLFRNCLVMNAFALRTSSGVRVHKIHALMMKYIPIIANKIATPIKIAIASCSISIKLTLCPEQNFIPMTA